MKTLSLLKWNLLGEKKVRDWSKVSKLYQKKDPIFSDFIKKLIFAVVDSILRGDNVTPRRSRSSVSGSNQVRTFIRADIVYFQYWNFYVKITWMKIPIVQQMCFFFGKEGKRNTQLVAWQPFSFNVIFINCCTYQK